MAYVFGDFELDTDQLELRRSDGQSIPLGQRALQTLGYLIEHRDRMVSRQELLDAIWPDAVVTDGSLSAAITQVRRALGERAGQSIIRTSNGRGYRFTAQVTEVTEVTKSGPDARRSPALSSRAAPVGRSREWNDLRARLLAAGSGSGGVVLLCGEPGIGKSFLVGNLAVEASAQGVHAIRVQVEPVEGAPAQWPALSLLRQLRAHGASAAPHGESAQRGHASAKASELSRSLCDFGVAYTEPPQDLEPAAARFELFDAITQALCRSAQAQPRLLILEDLQRAHVSCREWLAFAAPQLSAAAVLIVATQRSHADAAPVPGAHSLVLPPLDAESARELLAAQAHSPQSVAQRDAILAAARGNPLMLCELSRCVFEAGSRRQDTHTSGDEPWSAALVAAQRELVLQRFRSVSAPCRELLQAAACLGEEFGARLLAQLFGDDPSPFARLLSEAIDAGLIAAVVRSRARYRFEQAAFRAAIYDACPLSLRTQWHIQIAEQLDTERAALAACLDGAHRPSVLSRVDAGERIELLLQSAASRSALGAPEDELRKLYRQAFEVAEELGSSEYMARAALAFSGSGCLRGTAISPWPPRSDELELLRRAQAAQVEGSVWSVLVEARYGAMLSCTEDLVGADRHTSHAVRQAESLGDPRTLCEGLLYRARSLSAPGACDARIAHAEEALLVARHANLSGLLRDAMHERGMARLRAGLLTATELAELCEETDSVDAADAFRRMCWSLSRALLRGDLRELQALLPKARELACRTNPLLGPRMLEVYAWETEKLRGARRSEERLKTSDIRHYKPAVWMMFPWLFTMLESGHMRTARAGFVAAVAALPRLTQNRYWLPALGVAAWAAEVFDDVPRARLIHEQLAFFADENIVSVDCILHGPVRLFLGAAAMTYGDYALAHEHLDHAERSAERLDACVPLLHARKSRALVRMRQGEAGRGRRELELVRADLTRLGLTGLVQDLDADAARLLDQPLAAASALSG